MKTNEKKARKISGLCKDCFRVSCSTSRRMCKFLMRYNSAMQMAEWKDKQFEKVMKILKDELDADDYSRDNQGFCDLLRDIYYERNHN